MTTILLFQDRLEISNFGALLLLSLLIIGVGLLLLPATYSIHKAKSIHFLFFEIGDDSNYSKPALNIKDEKETQSEPTEIRPNLFILRLVGLCLILAVMLAFYTILYM